jgi:hypothetical protein
MNREDHSAPASTADGSGALGVTFLRLALVVGAIGVYVGLWVWFFVRIWETSGNGPVSLSSKAVYATSALGGVLGTFFAVSLGIQRKDAQRQADQRRLHLGPTMLGLDASSTSRVPPAIATLAVWAYALVGAWALLTVLIYSNQSGKAVTAMASAFASLVFGLFAGVLTPTQK